MLKLPNYEISAKIYESNKSQLYRGHRLEDGQPVVIKTPRTEYPSPRELTRLKWEYELGQRAAGQGVITYLALERYKHSLAIISEDFAGVGLNQILPATGFEITIFLQIALQLADGVASIHQHNVIHRDLKPSNIVITWPPDSENDNSVVVKIIDFGLASQFSRETQSAINPNQLEGTLAYLSPEQTGRMNRSIDYRSDFYSLGVTFYELLTGQLPFTTDDPLTLVHSHLARVPTPPHQLNLNIPSVLSDIIFKLMAKNMEMRYQSAYGLKADLRRCLHQLGTSGRLDRFELGRQDVFDRFQIPQKLYGRHLELSVLLSAFERITGLASPEHTSAEPSLPPPVNLGQIELVLVSGDAGIGKSVLVQELQQSITAKRGYFLSGKFEQYQHNIPYEALSQAFNNWCDHLLAERERTLRRWRQQILRAVGQNGQILIDVMPKLEQIIGPQPPVASVSPLEAQNRFNLVFQNFIRQISRADHPLVLFVDDLQWADRATLTLLKSLLTDPDIRHFLIIGAYRNDEVDELHPLTITLSEIQQEQGRVSEIELGNLQADEVNQLLSETLNCSPVYSQPLAELVHFKTQGNPFFVTEFLKSLYSDGLLTFHLYQRCWVWDINELRQRQSTPNVVDLMTQKIGHLPAETSMIVQLAACIGSKFDLKILAAICRRDQQTILSLLWQAITEGLVLPLDKNYKLIEIGETAHFQFLHDRVQQAAYSQLDETTRQATHLEIGRLFQQTYQDTPELDEHVFDIVNHFNEGASSLVREAEKISLAELNLRAGKKAKSATAYSLAVQYLTVGLELVGYDGWQEHYILTRDLHVEAVEAEYLNANLERAKQLSETVLQQARDLLEKVKLYELQMQFYVSQNQQQAAIKTALETLNLLGMPLPTDNQKMGQYAETLRAELPTSPEQVTQLITLPQMTVPHQLAIMRILMGTIPSAFQTSPPLLKLVVVAMVSLSVRHGNSAMSAVGYSFYAGLLCGGYMAIELGYEFGKLAMQVHEKFYAAELHAKVASLFNLGVRPWKEPVRASLKPLKDDVVQSGIQVGDFEYAYYNAIHYTCYLFFCGLPLETVYQRQLQYLAMIEKQKLKHHALRSQIWLQIIANLLGQGTAEPYQLIGDHIDETTLLPHLFETHNAFLIFSAHIGKVMLLYLFQHYAEAVAAGQVGEQYERSGAGIYILEHQFYYSLALVAQYEVDGQPAHLEKVTALQERMKLWADQSPINYQHKFDLIEAEKARIAGDLWVAGQLYEQAINGAKQSEYLPEEALAYELAGRFYLANGLERFAQNYLVEAYYRYSLWGAVVKVAALEAAYPQWLIQSTYQEPATGATPSTSSSSYRLSSRSKPSVELDFRSITKASQAISGEIELKKLLEKMMALVIENAGAERGVLLLQQAERWYIAAEAQGDEITVLQYIPVEAAGGSSEIPKLSTTIFNYVIRTERELVLDDASAGQQFRHSLYVERRQPKSVLCMPLLEQGYINGILYLENNLTSGAFTAERLEVLQVLSAQMAISLDNARLYDRLETLVEERTARLQMVAELSERLNAILDVERLLSEVVNQLKHSFGYYHAHVYLLDETKEDLLMVQGSGPAGAIMKAQGHHIRLHVQKSLVARAARSGEVVMVDDVRQAPDWLPNELLPDTFSEMAVPITYEGEVVGVLDVQQKQIAGLDEGDRNLLRSLANHIGVALRNAQLFSLAQQEIAERKQAEANLARRNATLAARNAIAATISRSLDLETVLEAALDQMLNLLELDAGLIYLFEEEEAKLIARAYRNISPTLLRVVRQLDTDAGITGQAFTSGQPVVLDVTHSTASIAPMLQEEGFQTIISAPLISKNQSIGAMSLGKKQTDTFDDLEMDLLAAFGQQIGVAVENAQLYTYVQQANEELSRLNADKDKFFSIVAHDLKGPFMPLLGSAELLSNMIDRLNPDQIKEMSKAIHRTGTQILALLENLLYWSRIQMGRMEYQPQPVYLPEIVERNLDLLAANAAEKGITLQSEMADKVWVYGDEYMLDTVIRNLTSNALKFTTAGDTVTISARLIESMVEICVADTGVGIAAEDRQKLFKIGVHHSTIGTAQEVGTGLGLILCKEMVEMNGGQIWVTSEEGVGSQFYFTIPFHEES